MKNIQGNQKSLKLRDEEGRVVYKFEAYGDGTFTEETYDKHGKELTYKNSIGYKDWENFLKNSGNYSKL
jgi:hypothetical protein